MGIFDLFQQTSTPHQDMVVPQAVTKNEINEEQLQQDLEKLKEFEEKIKGPDQEILNSPTQKRTQISQEEMALKLQNPFRGI